MTVVTIDGPSGSGKGTIAALLARELGWRLLDSGALYRLTALAAMNHGVDFDDESSLEVLAGHLDVQFLPSETGEGLTTVLEGERGGCKSTNGRCWCHGFQGCGSAGCSGCAVAKAA